MLTGSRQGFIRPKEATREGSNSRMHPADPTTNGVDGRFLISTLSKKCRFCSSDAGPWARTKVGHGAGPRSFSSERIGAHPATCRLQRREGEGRA